MATSTTPTYQGTKGTYTVYVGSKRVGTVTGGGKAWRAYSASKHTPTTHNGTTRAGAVAAMLAGSTLGTPNGQPAVPNGQYTPAAPGARTWRAATPLQVQGQAVTAQVANTPTGQTLAVHVGTRLAYQGPLPAAITAGHMVNPWVAQWATQHAPTTPPAHTHVWHNGACTVAACTVAYVPAVHNPMPATRAPQAARTPIGAPHTAVPVAQRPHSAPTGPAVPAAPTTPPAPRTPRSVYVVAVLVVLLRLLAYSARLAALPYAAAWWLAMHAARALARHLAARTTPHGA